MRYLLGIALLMLLLSACGQSDIDTAEGGIRAILKDPDSAIFSRVQIADRLKGGDPTVVCGVVNAKNSFGGYAGARRFYVMLSEGTAEMEPDSDSHDQVDDLSRQLFERQWAMSLCQLGPE
jgi:hypothetical protein